MNVADEKFLAYWTEKRKLGKNKFALRHGVFYFAMPAFVCSEVVKNLFQIGNHEISFTRFAIGLIVWSLLGYFFFGYYQWKGQEKRFAQLQKKEDQ